MLPEADVNGPRQGSSAATGRVFHERERGTFDALRLAWRLLRDRRVAPRLKWGPALLAGLYLLSPIDIVPDVFLGPGQVDDLGVLGLLLMITIRLVPRLAPAAVVDEHLAAMGLADEQPATPGRESVVDAAYRVRDR